MILINITLNQMKIELPTTFLKGKPLLKMKLTQSILKMLAQFIKQLYNFSDCNNLLRKPINYDTTKYSKHFKAQMENEIFSNN